ncbi:hypothetical protein [Legionella sp. PC997]|uniref:hypothetical protein n=1 Tax=Legionella sp. PC997 TaxID=2755562 RepID=UPI0015F8279F|nr:hypothetical protein [Legionella sp. PC997]QMT61269.1 hypothetical protein HBNCFIEN_02664 [Legionella sp. PC997]
MPTANPVVYNHADLLSWQKELTPLEQQISENLQFVESQRQQLQPYEEQLRSLNLRISLIEHQVSMDMVLAQDLMRPKIHYYGENIQVLETFKLQLELSRLQEERNILEQKMIPHEQAIIGTQELLQNLFSRRAWLNEHIPAAQLFLETLQENPMKSVQDLSNRIWDALANYEDTHLFDLSPQVRICLIAVRYLNQLTIYPGVSDPDYLNQVHRSNYLRLCGFLWDMYTNVKNEKKDAEFEKVLGSLIESTHIAQHGDLPYPLLTGYSATAWFESNKQSAPGCFAIQEYFLPILEEEILNNGLAYITQNKLLKPTALQKHIINAVNLIDAEVKLKKQKHEDIDYHFYGRTVLILNSALVNPTDKQLAQRLGDIAAYTSGSNSTGKQVLGGLLIVLGALLICSSIAGFITTCGSSSVLSAWGFSLGLSLLETELAFGIASTLAAATGVGLTFFAGPKAIESGRRKGLSQELIEIKDGMESYDAPPPYPYSAVALN